MSLIPQETQPLLANPQRTATSIGRESAKPVLAEQPRRRDSQLEARAYAPYSHDQKLDTRERMKRLVDNIGVGCVLVCGGYVKEAD